MAVIADSGTAVIAAGTLAAALIAAIIALRKAPNESAATLTGAATELVRQQMAVIGELQIGLDKATARLNQLETLRDEVQRLTSEVERLKDENTRLHADNARLRSRLLHLEEGTR